MIFPSDNEAISVNLVQAEHAGIVIRLGSLQTVQLQVTFKISNLHSKTLHIAQEQPQQQLVFGNKFTVIYNDSCDVRHYIELGDVTAIIGRACSKQRASVFLQRMKLIHSKVV